MPLTKLARHTAIALVPLAIGLVLRIYGVEWPAWPFLLAMLVWVMVAWVNLDVENGRLRAENDALRSEADSYRREIDAMREDLAEREERSRIARAVFFDAPDDPDTP